MMRQLVKHPDSHAPAVRSIEIDVLRPQGGLRLLYVVRGELDAIAWPALTQATRTDELWRHTCFETFVRAGGGEAYYELNFSPSSQWAAYRFLAYRTGMEAAYEIAAPRMAMRRKDDAFVLDVALALPSAIANLDWRVGVSAVIEAAAGGVSYWALQHGSGKADFHHDDGFALALAAERA